MSGKLYRYVPLATLTLAVTGGLVIKETGLRIAFFIVLIAVSMKLYEHLKKKELGYLLDEREYRYYLEAFRYSSVLLLAVFLALWALKEAGKVSADFYLGFSLAFFTFLIAHIALYRLLIWLR